MNFHIKINFIIKMNFHIKINFLIKMKFHIKMNLNSYWNLYVYISQRIIYNANYMKIEFCYKVKLNYLCKSCFILL